VISGAAFCPHPPALVPAVARDAAPELAGLRAACRASITRIASLSDRLLLVGAGERTREYPSSAAGTFAGFGVDMAVGLNGPADGAVELPLSLTVGAELVEDAIGDAVARAAVSVDAVSDEDADRLLRAMTADGRVGLVVMGDGSARRTTAAPGYLDERAIPFDDAVAKALGDGDAYALEDIDPELAAQLLVASAPAWRAAGRLLRNSRFEAELHSYEAPFGVAYFVATWVTRA
jgi:hypothetical protein